MSEAADTIPAFLEFLSAQGHSERTRTAYTSDLKVFARWYLENIGEPFSVDLVMPSDLRAFREYEYTTVKRSPATVNRRLASLTSYFRWAVSAEYARFNPADQLASVRKAPTAPRWLSRLDANRLVREVEHDVMRGRKQGLRNFALIQLMLNTGLRVNEVSSLTLDDLELSERKGSVTVRSGKGSKYRTVPLNATSRNALRDNLAELPEVDHAYVFVGKRGDQLLPSGILYLVKRYATKAGLADVTPHTLRHTALKALLDRGIDLGTIQRIAGHENVSSTLRYTTPSGADLQKAVDRLDS